MKLATMAILAALVLSLAAGPAQANPQPDKPAITPTAPASPRPHEDPTFPERAEPGWNDTADTSESLDIRDADQPDVHLEMDLNNDVTDPLLENHAPEPVEDISPSKRESLSFPEEPPDPLHDPLP